jgi:hypothetical protein
MSHLGIWESVELLLSPNASSRMNHVRISEISAATGNLDAPYRCSSAGQVEAMRVTLQPRLGECCKMDCQRTLL